MIVKRVKAIVVKSGWLCFIKNRSCLRDGALGSAAPTRQEFPTQSILNLIAADGEYTHVQRCLNPAK